MANTLSIHCIIRDRLSFSPGRIKKCTWLHITQKFRTANECFRFARLTTDRNTALIDSLLRTYSPRLIRAITWYSAPFTNCLRFLIPSIRRKLLSRFTKSTTDSQKIFDDCFYSRIFPPSLRCCSSSACKLPPSLQSISSSHYNMATRCVDSVCGG